MNKIDIASPCYPDKFISMWGSLRDTVYEIFTENRDNDKVMKAVGCIDVFDDIIREYRDQSFFISAVTVVLCRVQLAAGECYREGIIKRNQVLHIENILSEMREYIKRNYV
ncbi:MAG: hypothetical protein ACOCWO_02355 [Candidatus Muiribacteriaceae bacterium]